MVYFKHIFISALFAVSGFASVEKRVHFSQEVEVNENIPLEGWFDDFADAQKAAQDQQKPLLIAFLGPNWCPFSDKLEAEILGDTVFTKILKKDVILFKVDIPEDFEQESFVGHELKQQYDVDECPSIVLVDPKGQEIAKLEYLPIESDAFAGYIKQILADYERVSHLEKNQIRQMKIDELQYFYTRAGHLADETFKRVLLNQGLKVDKGSYFLLEQYGHMLASGHFKERKLKRVRNKILARDPKNELGCRRKLALLDFEALASVKKSTNTETVIQPIVDYLQKFAANDEDNVWQLEMKISQYLYSQNKIEESLKHAKASLAIAPEEVQKEIHQSIEYLQTASHD